jgi:hypothetical protein
LALEAKATRNSLADLTVRGRREAAFLLVRVADNVSIMALLGHHHASAECPITGGGSGHHDDERIRPPPASIDPIDLPDMLFGEIAVQPSSQKYFASPFGRNSFIDSPSRLDQRGVRVVTDVGCGMRWTRQRRKTSGGFADGEVVWSWRPDAGAKFRGR